MRREDRSFSRTHSINLNGQLYTPDPALIMGILNLTTDSFFASSRASDKVAIRHRVGRMIDEGMDILDLGAASSRPGAEILSPEEELSKLIPVIDILLDSFPELVISVDTIHWKVAEKVISSGVALINDISGGHYDSDMLSGIAESDVAYCCMHMKGEPANMNDKAKYGNVTEAVMEYFTERISRCTSLGICDLLLDPGFGFAKTSEHNFTLLRQLGVFSSLGLPILVGISRKRMVYGNLGSSPEEALNGTTALHMLALENGATVLRVHDVKEAKECVNLFKLYKG